MLIFLHQFHAISIIHFDVLVQVLRSIAHELIDQIHSFGQTLKVMFQG